MADRRYHLSEAADADLERLYEWGIDRFGMNAADQYYGGRDRIAGFGIHQPFWHLPAVFKVQLLGNVAQFRLEERKRLGGHRVRVDPGANGVAKAAPFFLMEDDDAWLTIKAKLVLDGVQSLLENFRADGFGSRRAE